MDHLNARNNIGTPIAGRQAQLPRQMSRAGTVLFAHDGPRLPINRRNRAPAMQADQIRELQVSL